MASRKPKSSKGNNPGEPSPSAQKGDESQCAICLKVIEDRSANSEGEDSVFCEGTCQRWLHRTCAGLTDPAFDDLRNSDDRFYCYQCFVASHTSEIKDLRNTIAELTKELSTLRSLLPVEASSTQKHNVPVPIPLSYSSAVKSKGSTDFSSEDVAPSPHHSLPPKPQSHSDRNERKFNVVIIGLAECPKGTPRAERMAMDEEAIVHSIRQQIPSFSPLCIRDCYRLGKYEHSSASRPRPILVSLNRASDVSLVLSKRFPPGSIHIRPDLPLEARRAQSIIRRERQSLIDQGLTDKRTIKIRGNRIFIGERLFGRVINDEFVKSDSLGDLAPPLSTLSSHAPDDPIDTTDSPGSFPISSTTDLPPAHDSPPCDSGNASSPLNTSDSTKISTSSVDSTDVPVDIQHPQ